MQGKTPVAVAASHNLARVFIDIQDETTGGPPLHGGPVES
jgi:hypothetical protein